MIKKLFNKTIVFVALVILSLLVLSGKINAQQYGQYGCGQYGCPVGKGVVLVDKLVRDPKTGEYVDNLGLVDSKYRADNAVFFRIVVQNVGDATLSRIDVVDYLPSYVKYVSGGSYDPATRQVRFSFDNVLAGEKRSTVLQVRVVSLDELPTAKSIVCPVNQVVASSTQDGSSEDTAQFCVERQVMAEKVPAAGDPIGLVLGFSALPTLFAGFKLRRKRA